MGFLSILGAVPMSAKWFKNNEPIPDCEDFTYVLGDNGKFGLIIADPFNKDSGTYSCKVINSFGEAVSYGMLIVNGKSTSTISVLVVQKLDQY